MRRLIAIPEAAEYIGLSRHTLYTMVSQRRVPFVKVGSLVKFDVELLENSPCINVSRDVWASMLSNLKMGSML